MYYQYALSRNGSSWYNKMDTTFPVYRDKSRSFSKKPYASYLDHFLLLRRDKYIAATSQVNNHCEIIDKITKLT